MIEKITAGKEPGQFSSGNIRRKRDLCPDCLMMVLSNKHSAKITAGWSNVQDAWQQNPTYVAFAPTSAHSNVQPDLVIKSKCSACSGYGGQCYSISGMPAKESYCSGGPSDGGGGSSGTPGPCDITSQTVDPPAPQNRVTIGVGEQVNITTSGLGLYASGDGAINGTTLTAGPTSGSVTVQTNGRGQSCAANSITFNVVQPSGNYYVTTGVIHDYAFQDVGIHTNVYLQPDGVSFQAVSFQEREVGNSATGAWACLNGQGHHPNPSWISAGVNVPGYGAPVGSDTAYSGSCGGPYYQPPYSSGNESYDIPDWYQVSGGQYNYSSTLQQATATADNAGDLMMQKGDPPASGSTTVLAPTKT